MSLNSNKKGPVFDPGTCRCCGASKKCRVLDVEYEHGDKKEVYADMFVECFGLLLSHMEGEACDRLICGMCVSRLREASAFRRQVLQCEEKLLKDRIQLFDAGDERKVGEPLLLVKWVRERSGSRCNDAADQLAPQNLKDNLQYGAPPMEIKTEVIIKAENEDETNQCDDEIADDMEIEREIIQPEESPKVVVPTQLSCRPEGYKPDAHLRAKRLLQQRILRTKEQVLRIQRAKKLKLQKQQKAKKTYTIPPSERFIDEDSLAFKNNVTMVEFSYTCPFQTTYSSYSCVYCRESFADPIKLREHNLKHDPRRFKDAVQDSKKPTYLDIERIDCRLCDKKIDRIEDLKTHLKNHGKILNNVKDEFLKFKLSVGPISCTECDSSFMFFHALKRHMAVHFGSFVCDICAAHYFDKQTLKKHIRSAHKGDLYAECHECGKMFKSKHSLYLHMSAVHKKDAAFQCCRCDAILFSHKDRYKHMLEEHGEAISYPCETCGKVYANRKNLREHARTVHLGLRKQRCGACDTQPRRDERFQCATCGNSYPRLHYLKLHMQSHAPS